MPPGVHQASLNEIADRFGFESELRRVQMESLNWLVERATRAGVKRIVINGSFTTAVFEPNDVDCVLLIEADFPLDDIAGEELLGGLPFLEVNLVNQADLEDAGRIVLRQRPTIDFQRYGGGDPMNLQNTHELQKTREKLRLLEDRFAANQREQAGDRRIREISMRSLKRLINQLKEEIARYEAQGQLKKSG